MGNGPDPGRTLAIGVEGPAADDPDPFVRVSLNAVDRPARSFEEPDAATSVTVKRSVWSIGGEPFRRCEPLNSAI